MPVHTAALEHPAAPARLVRLRKSAGTRWMTRSLLMSLGALLIAGGLGLEGWWAAVPLGVAATVVAVHEAGLRHAAALGAWGGLLFAVVHLGWLRSVGVDATVAIAVMFAMWWSVMVLGTRLVLTLRLWPILVPTVWVLQEWLRSAWPLGGFPWARLGYSSLDSPLARWIPYLGAYGLTYLLAVLGTVVAAVVVCRGRSRAIAGAVMAGVVIVVLGSGWTIAPTSNPAGAAFEVGVVQGGPQLGRGSDQARAVLTAHAKQTKSLAKAATRPFDLVLWPESSTDIDPLADPWARSEVASAVVAIDAPIVVGAVTASASERDRVRNQAIVWSPTSGPGASYTKQRLVPFGEYLPARALLERLSSRFGQLSRDFVAGSDPSVVQVGPVSLGVLICYEVAFDDLARDAVEAGATVLAVPSNNATYRGTAQPDQQLAIARFRALETSRSVLVASTTGVSAIIRPDGAVASRLEDGAAGTLAASVIPNSEITPAVRWGGVLAATVALVGAISIAFAARRQWRARPRAGAGQDSPDRGHPGRGVQLVVHDRSDGVEPTSVP